MTSKTSIAIAAAGLVALGGCGTQNATDAANQQAGKATKQAKQSAQSLSPQAKGVLSDAQGLAADVTATASGYASRKLTRSEAMSRLETYRQRAAALSRKARGLPTGEPARSRLTRLTDQLDATAQKLQSSVQGNATDVQGSVDRLRTQLDRTLSAIGA
jgi:hypothetical protein